MNDQIGWDQSLIKKYSSSNHYKLLNQLRNEVKKYPLKNKKILVSNTGNDKKTDQKNNPTRFGSGSESLSHNIKPISETKDQKSTVSFNNSKNFSIYNNSTNDSIIEYETNRFNLNKINEESTSSTFSERLNKIELK